MAGTIHKLKAKLSATIAITFQPLKKLNERSAYIHDRNTKKAVPIATPTEYLFIKE
ncbi:hypothetical protein [Lactobacillus hamsteri]|uniref:hypothetical protein n=1 Tax=Lactobacillus hamsteri TaxID=96565 RepID=UPI0012DF1056|nr:hypothetical protein [Lactobacillus hamsteri]